ncbi:DUF4279 domain-containing protein [Vibrio sp. WJH972]
MNSYRYKVSLRVRHPYIEPERICEELGLTPSRMWCAGKERRTPTGAKLDGIYDETYCTFRLPHEDDERLPEFLLKANKHLKSNAEFFDEIVSTGGDVEYFIGWFINGNSGDVFDSTLIQQLAKLNITLSFDIYP